MSMDVFAVAANPALIARARSGDLGALEELYRAFETPVYNLGRRILRNEEDAEDVLQETFLEVIRSIGRYRGEGSLWGWVRQIAASKALMKLRSERYRRTEELDESVAGHVDGQSSGIVRLDLETAFTALTPTSRAVVWLHDVEGYTHEEIAEKMGKTASFSKSQLARAHQRLRKSLAAGEQEGVR